MIQAVFLDYTGTMVQERGREMEEVVARICQNSDLSGPREVLTLWWTRLRAYEEASYLDTYQTEDQIVDRLLEEFSAEFHLREDLQVLDLRAPLSRREGIFQAVLQAHLCDQQQRDAVHRKGNGGQGALPCGDGLRGHGAGL